MKKLFYLLLLISVSLEFSCEENDECQPTKLKFEKELKDFLTEDCAKWGEFTTRIDIDLQDNYTIIRGQQEFESRILEDASCYQIDFSLYDLVIGKKQLTTGNKSINYELTKECSDNLKLKVIFNQNLTMEAPIVVYYALIPKLGNKQTVNVEFDIVD